MRNIFKKLIPKENSQEVTELESWTLKWVIQGNTYNSTKVFHKCFICDTDAKEYEKQLKSAANLLGTWVDTSITKN